MAIEIERKFLVQNDTWRQYAGKGFSCRQGYLVLAEDKTVRVRTIGNKAYLTIKGKTTGIRRNEFEYEIPMPDAIKMMDLCGDAIIEKKRYFIEHSGMLWELDVFLESNAGLIIAEIELETEDQSFELPEWVGEDVSNDPRYFNAALSQHPFRDFKR